MTNTSCERYLLEQRAILDTEGGKLLNEDNDEKENFRRRRTDNENSVILTTIHQVWLIFYFILSLMFVLPALPLGAFQSKGLEWDIVFIVKDDMSLEVNRASDKDTKEASCVLSLDQNQCKEQPSLIGFVVDERLRMYKNKHKVLRWEQMPPEKRAHLMREKQEQFQKLRMETAMNSSSATPKQIAYLRSLGSTVVPESRLHASRLIEQYKSV
ncbi:ATP-dependent DNA helicase SRS2-like protein [Drosera capensis]